MNYISTRGDQTPRGFSEILLEGLAPDGGLYLPTHLPEGRRGDARGQLARPVVCGAWPSRSCRCTSTDIPAADLKRLSR